MKSDAAQDGTGDILARQRDVVLLQHEHDRRLVPGLLLHLVVEFDALSRIQFRRRLRNLVCQLRIMEVAAPGDDLHRAVVGIVGIGVEGLRVGVRIEVVRKPFVHDQLVLAGPHLREDLLA